MTRRLALAGCALAVAAALSGCTQFSDNAVVARVGDAELSHDDMQELMGIAPVATTEGATGGEPDAASVLPLTLDGAEVRQQIQQWIRVALIEEAAGVATAEIESATNLEDRLAAGLETLSAADPDAGRAAYEQGLPASTYLCLGAIPIDERSAAEAVAAQIEAGELSFADAAAQHSTDPTLADNGGVVFSGEDECLPTAQVTPIVTDALAGRPPGSPIVVDLDGIIVVVQMRPYDDLSDAGKALVGRAGLTAEQVAQLVERADVYVDPYYGYWDSVAAAVLPLGG